MENESHRTVAILSDVHGNIGALEQVYADMDACGVSESLCLGDAIGYGAHPAEVVALLKSRGTTLVMGNHEQGLINGFYLSRFNQPAQDMLLKTRTMLDDAIVEWLVTRPKSVLCHGARGVHGCPPDSVATYVWHYKSRTDELFRLFVERICFVGHTHELQMWSQRDGVVAHQKLGAGAVTLDASARYVINAGSVGQPRDGNPAAKYLLWQPDTGRLEVRFVRYDVDRAAEDIRAIGFHRGFADRLYGED